MTSLDWTKSQLLSWNFGAEWDDDDVVTAWEARCTPAARSLIAAELSARGITPITNETSI